MLVLGVSLGGLWREGQLGMGHGVGTSQEGHGYLLSSQSRGLLVSLGLMQRM